MRDSWKTLAAAVLATAAATQAQAGGFGHSGGASHMSSGMGHASNFSASSGRVFSSGNVVKSAGPVQNGNKLPSSGLNKLNHNNISKLGLTAGKPNINKGLAASGLKGKPEFKKGKFSSEFFCKNWWGCGFGWGCCGPWYCGYWGGCWDPCYCLGPYYWPSCGSCFEYCVPQYTCFGPPATPDLPEVLAAPAAATPPQAVQRIIRISNPADTGATLGFAVNGQNYTLEAGGEKDLPVGDAVVVEFDRGNGDAPGRYSLSEGAYRFTATPNGWELFRAEAAPADAVAAN